MWSITMQMMKKNVRMLIHAGIAFLIGTAIIAATLLVSNALDASMTETQTELYGDANYAVTPAQNAPDSVYENTVGDFHIDRLEAVDGVEGARPNVEGHIAVQQRVGRVDDRNTDRAVRRRQLCGDARTERP